MNLFGTASDHHTTLARSGAEAHAGQFSRGPGALKKATLAGLGAALLGAAAIAAPSALGATGQNGVCETGEFCLYYNSAQGGSMVDLANNHTDYGSGAGCITFITAGAGRGTCVKNSAASVWNREPVVVTVFYKSDWAGAIDSIPSGARTDLNTTLKNNNAGHLAGDSANTNLGFGLYQASGGRISAYFDGYLVTSGRHEGTDVARSIGSPVYSLTNGRVTNVVQGSTGSSGLSTIAIYNASLDKTVVYLHTNPLDTLHTGDTVTRGQQIATESWRGVSSSAAAHTHVEMRLGEKTLAAPSVGDSTLSNPIPTDFWMNRGYNICCS